MMSAAPSASKAEQVAVDWTYVTQESNGEVSIVEVPLAQVSAALKPQAVAPHTLSADFGDRLAVAFEAAVQRVRQP
jgi:hypothetical protein